MNEYDLTLLREGLKFADDSLAKLQEVNNEYVKHIAILIHSAICFGETLIRREK